MVHLDRVNVLPRVMLEIASDLRTLPCNFLSNFNLSVNRAAVQYRLLAQNGVLNHGPECPLSDKAAIRKL